MKWLDSHNDHIQVKLRKLGENQAKTHFRDRLEEWRKDYEALQTEIRVNCKGCLYQQSRGKYLQL